MLSFRVAINIFCFFSFRWFFSLDLMSYNSSCMANVILLGVEKYTDFFFSIFPYIAQIFMFEIDVVACSWWILFFQLVRRALLSSWFFGFDCTSVIHCDDKCCFTLNRTLSAVNKEKSHMTLDSILCISFFRSFLSMSCCALSLDGKSWSYVSFYSYVFVSCTVYIIIIWGFFSFALYIMGHFRHFLYLFRFIVDFFLLSSSFLHFHCLHFFISFPLALLFVHHFYHIKFHFVVFSSFSLYLLSQVSEKCTHTILHLQHSPKVVG